MLGWACPWSSGGRRPRKRGARAPNTIRFPEPLCRITRPVKGTVVRVWGFALTAQPLDGPGTRTVTLGPGEDAPPPWPSGSTHHGGDRPPGASFHASALPVHSTGDVGGRRGRDLELLGGIDEIGIGGIDQGGAVGFDQHLPVGDDLGVRG